MARQEGPMNLGIDRQVALVTGSSRGIGLAIAEEFLAEGARVIITGRDQEVLRSGADRLRKDFDDDRVLEFPCDLTEERDIATLEGKMRARWGILHHLVCNVGSGRSVPVLQEDAAEWDRMLKTNLLGAAACVRILQPLMVESAHKSGTTGSIVFVGSICGVEALGCPLAYATAKAGLVAYAANLAGPLAQSGLRVNCVSPGNILFPGSTWERKRESAPDEVDRMIREQVPLARFGTPGDVAAVVVFLASQKSGFVTGANWVVDGGQTRGW